MSITNKKFIALSTILLLFMICAISGRLVQFNNCKLEEIDNTNKELKIKIANGYSPSYIHIDASDNANWSNTASAYDWCYEIDGVFYIENCSIDASLSPTGSGIFIKNSKSVKFIIQNCSVYNAGPDHLDAGIKLENTCNGTLIKNDFSNNNYGGIVLNNGCKNNIISRNIVNNNDVVGIYSFNQCNNNTIEFNVVSENNDVGIVLDDYCSNNTISSNIAQDNGDFGGIYLEDYCDDNIIYNNTVGNDLTTDQNFGIYLYMYCDKNIIMNNTASNNYWYGISFETACDNNILISNIANNNGRYGIYIESWCNYNNITNCEIRYNTIGLLLETGCNNNTFINNKIINNSQYGAVIEYYTTECLYNLFYRNIFNNPLGINALDNCSHNRWDNGITGNQWHDYIGKDENDDGIGDTPYNGIGGTGGAQDNFPIWWDAPVFSLIAPIDSQSFTNAPSFEISIDEGVANTMWYTLDDGITNNTFPSTTGTIDETIWNSLTDGQITLTFYVNDSRDYEATVQVQITKVSSEAPPEISGYSIMMIIGVTVIMSGIIARRRLKK